MSQNLNFYSQSWQKNRIIRARVITQIAGNRFDRHSVRRPGLELRANFEVDFQIQIELDNGTSSK